MKRRHFLQCGTVALVVWLVWLSASVRHTDRRTFDMHAIELERTGTWRYGYVPNYRGDILVRTRLATGAPPLAPVTADDRNVPMITRELHAHQQKAAVEAVLYGTLWAICLSGVLRIRRIFARVYSSRQQQHSG